MRFKLAFLAGLVIFIIPAVLYAFQPLFDTWVNYELGTLPHSIVAADLDGDGDLDVVATNSSGPNFPAQGNSISVMKNEGDGTFAAAISYDAGRGPQSVVPADLDSDGDLDLAVANLTSDSISILMNNGDGTFTAPVHYAGGRGPFALVASDLDADSDIDLAVTNFGFEQGNTVSIFRNNGDGTFASKVDYSFGIGGIVSVTASDLDGDGDFDLAIAGRSTFYGWAISVLNNNGDATFAPKADYDIFTTINVSSELRSVVVSDFNGDGKLDLAVYKYRPDSLSGISVLMNNGDGTFAPKVDYDLDINDVRTVVNSDLDGDGDQDFVISGSITTSILTNDGNGAFVLGEAYEIGYVFMPDRPGTVLAGDLDRDGDPDLALAGLLGLTILKNDGSGMFPHAVSRFATGRLPAGLAAADLDGDGDRDLAVANSGSDSVSILLNSGDGTFAPKVDYPSGDGPIAVAASDLDGDGDFDLAVADTADGSLSILLNNGNGTFAPGIGYEAGTNLRSLAAVDLDGDGDNELAFVDADSNTLSVLKNDGAGGFAARMDYETGAGPHSIFAFDVDSDGDIDLVVANTFSYPTSTVSVFKNNGDGTFSPKVDYQTGVEPNLVTSPQSVFVRDLDGDGDGDLAVANNPNTIFVSGTVSVLKNRGDGDFELPTVYPAGFFPISVAVADFTGDGRGDIAVANLPLFSSLLENRGDGTFAGRVGYYAQYGRLGGIVASDLDGNSTVDLAVTASYADGSVNIFKNLRTVSPCAFVPGDLNGDAERTPADIILLLNCVFQGTGTCGACFADVNCNGELTITDVVVELSAVFSGLPLGC